MIEQLQRPDCVVLSAIAIAFYITEHREKLRRIEVRNVTVLLMMSLFYDIVWAFIVDPSSQAELHSALDNDLATFLRIVSSVSFFWRIIVAFTMWKCSLDFVKTLK